MLLTEEQKEQYRQQGLTEEQIQALENGGDENQPPPPPQNDPVPAWQAALFEQNQSRLQAEERAAAAERRLNELQTQQAQPNRQVLEQGEVFNNPERFRQVLNQDMQAQVAPLNTFVEELQRKDSYHTMKSRIKALYPQFNAIFSSLEPHLDNTFLSNSQMVPTEHNIVREIKLIVGELVLSQANRPQTQQQAPQNNNQQNYNQPNRQQNNNSDMLPPHLRPSNRSNNQNQSQPDQVDESQFTENDRRLMRESRMSSKEYVTMRDCPPHLAEQTWKKILADRKKGGQQ